MKLTVYNKDYTYVDVRSGTIYPAHTCTDADEENRPDGEDMRFAIANGGDHTNCQKRVLTASVLGTSRGG